MEEAQRSETSPGLFLNSVRGKQFVSDKRVLVSQGELLRKLRNQVEAGFRRRDRLFVEEIYNRYSFRDHDNGSVPSYLPKSKLRIALHDLDIQIDENEADELFSEFDSDRSDGLDLEELDRLLRKPRRLDEWIRTLPLSEVVSDSVPRVIGKDPLRTASELTEQEESAMFQALQMGIERVLRTALGELRKAFQITDSRKREELSSKFNIIALSCGQISDFHAGIEARVGELAVLSVESPIFLVRGRRGQLHRRGQSRVHHHSAAA